MQYNGMKIKIVLLSLFIIILITGCAKTDAVNPEFKDGMAQPVFSYTENSENDANDKSTIVRYSVWVETDNDMNQDGEKDLIKAFVQVPRAAYEGKYKAASIFEADPYLTIDQAGNSIESAFNSAYYLVRGFAVVTSAGPGTSESDGFVSVGSNEETEAFAAVIEWIHGDRTAYADRNRTNKTVAEWSNGNVGMTGQFYGGATQYALAARGVEGLKTIVPVDGITSWYAFIQGLGVSLDSSNAAMSFISQSCSGSRYDSEELNKEKYLEFIASMDSDIADLKGNYGDFWKEREYIDRLEDNRVSVLAVAGMNDDIVRTNQLSDLGLKLWDSGYEYKVILHQGGNQPLSNPMNQLEIMIGDKSFDEILNRWFSHYLYDVDNGIQDMALVQYQSNIDGSWNAFDPFKERQSALSYKLDKASVSSKTLPVSFNDWNEDIWYKKDNSAVKRYELATAEDEGIDIIENIVLNLKLTLDNVPKNPDNLMVSAYLVDEYNKEFNVYSSDESYQVPTEIVKAGTMEQVPGKALYDYVEYKQTRSDHKVISRVWFDICNPEAGEGTEGCIKRKEPVEKGQTYEYKIVMDPTFYRVSSGHKLVLYIFSYDLGRISVNSVIDKIPASFYHGLNCEYGFTINPQSRLTIQTRGEEESFISSVDPSKYELKEEKKIIIDSDTAGDDAMAIMMAAKSPKVKIMGVTVLPGNVDMQQALNNALMTLETVNCDAPVYAGSETFISGEVPATFSIFGTDGMGDEDLIHPTRKPEEGSGIDFIIDTVKNNPGEIEIVEIGPSTNLALAVMKDPETMKKVKKIWIMGSAGQGIGNATPVAEFNVYKDAKAVEILLNSGIPITFVGWDLALDNRTYFYYNDLLRLADASEEGKFFTKAFSKLADNKLSQYGEYYADLADPIAMAACIWPDYITAEKSCYAFCCTDKNNMPVYGQVVYFDKDKTYDAKFTIPDANCTLASSQKADETVDRIIELFER